MCVLGKAVYEIHSKNDLVIAAEFSNKKLIEVNKRLANTVISHMFHI